MISHCQVLSSLLPFIFSSQEVSPFQKHNILMAMFVVSIVIHAIACAIEGRAQNPNYQTIAVHTQQLAGFLALSLIVRILLPYCGLLLLSLWICVFIWVAWNSSQHLPDDALHQFKKLTDTVKRLCYMNTETPNEIHRNANEPTQNSVEEGSTPTRLELEDGDQA